MDATTKQAEQPELITVYAGKTALVCLPEQKEYITALARFAENIAKNDPDLYGLLVQMWLDENDLVLADLLDRAGKSD